MVSPEMVKAFTGPNYKRIIALGSTQRFPCCCLPYVGHYPIKVWRVLHRGL